jgi:ABC-2 type transport system ATP-binding protein
MEGLRPSNLMIRIDNLHKKFAGRPALEGVSFEVRRGEIFGLLGHNGAGKSTTFGILLGQVYPNQGEAFIDGISVQKNRARALRKVGAIFETPGFYDYLSGWKNLEILAAYSGKVSKTEIEDAVHTVGLETRIHDPVKAYSHGMRQRLALAQALVPIPEAVLLDEPTEGLDPEGIHEMREMIKRLNRERGLTVMLSSHLLSEVQQLCDRVAILHQGQMMYEGRWTDLAGDGRRYRLEVDDWDRAKSAGVRVVDESGIIELDANDDVADLVQRLVSTGTRVRAVVPLKPTLESLYLDLIHGRNGVEGSRPHGALKS